MGTISNVHEDLIQEFGGPQSARKVFEGKIVGVGQSVHKGHSYGLLIVERLKDHERENTNRTDDEGPERVSIPFKNENLVIEAEYASGEKKVSPFHLSLPNLVQHVDVTQRFKIVKTKD
jgi:DUF917 family protein